MQLVNRPWCPARQGGRQPLGRTATKVVAASNATTLSKLCADYVCDGTADEVAIKAAHDALPTAGGTIILTDGTFTLGHVLNLSTPAGMSVIIRGQGMEATTIDCPEELEYGGSNRNCAIGAYQFGMTDRNAVSTPTSIQGDLIFEDLEIKGNQSGSATVQQPFASYGMGSVIFRRCYIHNFAGSVICHADVTPHPAREYRMEDCRLEDFGYFQAEESDVFIARGNRGVNFGCFLGRVIDGLGIVADNQWDTWTGEVDSVAVVHANLVALSHSSGLLVVENNNFYDVTVSPIGWDEILENAHIVIRGNRQRRGSRTTAQLVGLDGVDNALRVACSVLIEGNYGEYAASGYGSIIEVFGISNVTIRDNTLKDVAQAYLIKVGPTSGGDNPENVLIEGNKLIGAGWAASNYGIEIEANNYKVCNNMIAMSTNGFNSAAIGEAAGAGPGEIYNNDISQNAGGGGQLITTVHADTRVWGNKGCLTNGLIADPGDGNAIPVSYSGYVPLVTGGAETRTLAAPSFIGQEIDLFLDTDGGDCVVTTAVVVNITNNNTITFDNASERILLRGISAGGTKEWSVVSKVGVALSTV